MSLILDQVQKRSPGDAAPARSARTPRPLLVRRDVPEAVRARPEWRVAPPTDHRKWNEMSRTRSDRRRDPRSPPSSSGHRGNQREQSGSRAPQTPHPRQNSINCCHISVLIHSTKTHNQLGEEATQKTSASSRCSATRRASNPHLAFALITAERRTSSSRRSAANACLTRSVRRVPAQVNDAASLPTELPAGVSDA